MSKLGQRLQQLRTEHQFSQHELAKKVGTSRSSISMYECDDRWPDFETLDNLADLFDVSFDYLLGHSDVNTGYPEHNRQRLEEAAAFSQRLVDAYQHASADTQAAVRAILHLEG